MINSLLTALGRLSALPLGARFRKVPEGRESEVMICYPLAGLLVGILPVVMLVISFRIIGLSEPLAAAVALVTMALVTGLQPLAGLARTADAVGSGKPAAEETAEADAGHIGVYGVIAVVLVLLVKLSALTALTGRLGLPLWPTGMTLAILLASALARWAAVITAAHSEYARPEGGEDEWMVRYCGAREHWWSLAIVVAMAVGAGVIGYFTETLPWYRTALAAVGCFVLGYLASLYFERRLGGITGEQMNAVIEVGETLALGLMCALQPLGGFPARLV